MIKKLILSFCLITTFVFGEAAIFSGNYIKFLKAQLNLKDAVYITTRSCSGCPSTKLNAEEVI